MTNDNLLFSADTLSRELDARLQAVSNAVNHIPQDRFLVSNDDEVIENITHDFKVEPIVLLEDSISMKQQETQVDVSGDQRRYFRSPDSGPFYIPGTRIDVEIPFQGEEWLFHCRTAQMYSVLPRAKTSGRKLRISIAIPHDHDREEFKEIYTREVELIKQYIALSCGQVAEFNKNLTRFVGQAVAARRERLRKHANIAELLDIPLAQNPDAPTTTPVTIVVRRPPPLPVAPETGLKPEPGINPKDYKLILHFIRHQGRTFERTPSTFAVHDEEDLRNIILAQLNGYFQGHAGGEVFRNRGKTDLCIEQDNRVAFVAECKNWTGPSSLNEALDQLLGYLTWRDSKAAVILFNTRNKRFSAILESIPETVKDHPLLIRIFDCEESGEWHFLMRSAEDEGRRVTVHIFAFNLYQNP